MYDINTKFLIEINPSFTHNSTYSYDFIKGKSQDNIPHDSIYHNNKLMHANALGYQLLCIWDWDNADKVISLIKNKLQADIAIYARKCSICEISQYDANKFLKQYHLQNGATKQTICLGLFYENELVQVMTFGKPRYNKNYEYELIRLCSSKRIIGGTKRLFKYFVETYKPNTIISYCDLSKFTGKVYTDLGFVQSYVSIGKHWYNMSTNKHFTDNYLRMHGADRLLGTSYGKGSSNEEIMLKHGYVEIYDCGQATYVWHANNQQQ